MQAKIIRQRSSFIGALRGLLAHREDPRGAACVFGLTGFAFRLSVGPRADLSGPSAFPWAQELPAAVARLGYETELVCADELQPIGERLRRRALELCTERGPALVWGIHLPEFGLAQASEEPGRLAVSGVLDEQGGPRILAAEAFGTGDVPILFVLALGAHEPVAADEAVAQALKDALRLAYRGYAPSGYGAGLAGYDTWLEALRSGQIDPAGHAYTVQIAAEAREQAAAFLETAELGGADLGPAAAEYARVAATLGELARRTPFPPDRPLDGPGLEAAAALLARAREAEERGLGALETALEAHARRTAAAYRIEPAQPGDLFGCLADLPLSGLEPAAQACRTRLSPRLGETFFALVAREPLTDRVIGHVYYAPLAQANYPVAAEGNLLFLFCPWIAKALRGRGIGRRLFDALRADATARSADGILTEASTLAIFLPEEALAREGFRELARFGETRLCYLPIRNPHPIARYLPAEAAPQGTVRIRHTYNCPLLHATRLAAAAGAREAGMRVDEADAAGPEAGIAVGGERLANLPAAPDVLIEAIRARNR